MGNENSLEIGKCQKYKQASLVSLKGLLSDNMAIASLADKDIKVEVVKIAEVAARYLGAFCLINSVYTS